MLCPFMSQSIWAHKQHQHRILSINVSMHDWDVKGWGSMILRVHTFILFTQCVNLRSDFLFYLVILWKDLRELLERRKIKLCLKTIQGTILVALSDLLDSLFSNLYSFFLRWWFHVPKVRSWITLLKGSNFATHKWRMSLSTRLR